MPTIHASECATAEGLTDFQTKVCEHAPYYGSLATKLYLTDFNPLTVDWTTPVPWGNDPDTCNMEGDDSGCLMPLGAGFGIVLGFGVFFSVITTILTMLETKFAGVEMTSEHFNTAGRDVKTGLTASVIVSQWTWAATLLQSSNVAWNHGISGPFWYASGATIQILLYGILALEVKRRAPNSHTFLELVNARWGKAAHLTFMVFCFFAQTLVTMMLILGGADCMEATSGMRSELAAFLIPLGVIWYTMVGGLKATFLASYIHTCIIFIGLVVFVSVTYSSYDCDVTEMGEIPETQCNSIGDASQMWERLQFITSIDPVKLGTNGTAGAHHGPAAPDPITGESLNRGGSYVTMLSTGGIEFGVINIVGNFGTVFVDQSYYQSAIAASPSSVTKGYMLGGMVWFTIPFSLATSLGLAGNALNVKLSGAESGRGLTPPASATVMMGRGGGVFMIIMLFMAITSTGSAECIAISSVAAYDIYRGYINPKATGKQILKVSRVVIVAFGIFQGVLACILLGFGKADEKGCFGIGWVYTFMGNLIGSAVFPISCLLTHNGINATGAIVGAWAGMVGALISWIIYAGSVNDGAIDTCTLSQLKPCLAGNMVALGLSMILCTIISALSPQNFDWKVYQEKITLVDDVKPDIPEWEMSEEFLDFQKKWIFKWGWYSTFFLIVIWPAACVPFGVLPKAVYNLWASVAFMWGWTASIVICVLPLYENKKTFYAVLSCTPFTKEAALAKKEKEVEVTGA
jgi:Na+/proline symporter